ncbi:hypothetical protein CWI39_0017p0040 [Hamiltosporidium magnivora]|uniref:Uncharacterized protein n=1 Tax=Hamiltosporidium magnivora TaxID=148818 RepID=A0A4V2JX15_9MICR|nr:hypothetical protein CWI39_0017p0040 [Hamiltosporidium magnivora]
MNIPLIIILSKLFCSLYTHVADDFDGYYKMINMLCNEANKLSYPVELRSRDQKCFHIIMTNTFQNVIEDISLSIPHIKIFFEAHINKIQSLFLECLNETIKEQIEQIVSHGGESYINEKMIYRSIFLMFKNMFISKYLQFCADVEFLNESEKSAHKSIILNELLAGPDSSFLDMLDKIKSNQENEKVLNTQDEKIKIVENSIKDNVFLVFLSQFVFVLFVDRFRVLNNLFTELTIFDLKKNRDCFRAEIERNRFIKTIKRIYTKTNWNFPRYYQNESSLKIDPKIKNAYFDSLIYTLSCNKLMKSTPSDLKSRCFSFIIDFDEVHIPIINTSEASNCIFPKCIPPTFLNILKSLFHKFSPRILYLDFVLDIKYWLHIFIVQLISEVGKEKFLSILRTTFSSNEPDLQKELKSLFTEVPNLPLFCEEIMTYLELLKGMIKSSTYVAFYIFKIEPHCFNLIFMESITEFEFKEEILNLKDAEEFEAKIQENIMHCFSFFFKYSLSKYFKTEGLIMKKFIFWE